MGVFNFGWGPRPPYDEEDSQQCTVSGAGFLYARREKVGSKRFTGSINGETQFRGESSLENAKARLEAIIVERLKDVPRSKLAGLNLTEGGVRAIVERWNNIDHTALLIEFAAYVLQASPTRENLVAYMEKALRAENERRKALKEGK